MKSNDKNILNEIEYMVTSEDFASQEKNIFIDGSWGIGKTYFFNNDLKDLFEKNDYEIIYISLFGKKDIFSIKDTILSQLTGVIFKNKNVGVIERIKRAFKEDKNISITDKIKNTKQEFSSFCKCSSNKIISNFSKLRNSVFKMDISVLLDIYGDNLDNFLNKNLVICFDDCERVASQEVLPEFLGILDLLKRNKKIFLISIGNMAQISDKNFTAYKEKSFTRFFTLYKSSEDVLKIILDKYKFSETFKESYKKSLTRIFNYKDMHLEKLSSEERNVYDVSKDIFTNIRILEKISDGIKRLEDFLKQSNSFDLYEQAIEYWVSSFFFFGLLSCSSKKFKDFSFYKDIYSYYDWNIPSTKFAKFEQIVSARVGDMFRKMESAYLYFKEGYLDEQYILNELEQYRLSKIYQVFPDIFSHDFWVTSFYMTKDELISKRKDIVGFISKNTDIILQEDIRTILRALALLEVLLNREFNDTEILKKLVDNFDIADEDSIPNITEAKENTECTFVNKYREKLHRFNTILTKYARYKLYKRRITDLYNAIDEKDFYTVKAILKEMEKLSPIVCEKITNAMLEAISVPTDNNQLSIFEGLCKYKKIRELFLDKIEKVKKDSKNKIRPEFYEWLIYCFKK